MKKISIIVPCFNEEEAVSIFYREVKEILNTLEGYEQEIIYVNDGSRDQTLDEIKKLAEEDPSVLYVSFSRNFGKEAAMYAGLKTAAGDYVAIMDVDLQDPPVLLKEMVTILEEGVYDSVATRRVTRKGEPPIRSFFAKCYYKLINSISKVEIMDGARDFRMMKRQMVDAILELEEYNRFTKGIYSWVGFETKWLEFENVERSVSSSKWSFWKLFLYSLDSIVAFTTVPLAIASIAGMLLFAVAMVLIIFVIVRTLCFGDPTSGWPSLVCIISLIGGVQLLSVGILGQYLSKTYQEVKRRPIYIVKDTNVE